MNAEELLAKLAESGTGKEKLRNLAKVIASTKKGRKMPVKELIPMMAETEGIPPGTIAKAVYFGQISDADLSKMAKASWPLDDQLEHIRGCLASLRKPKDEIGEDYLKEAERQARDEQKQLEEDYLEGDTQANEQEKELADGKGPFKGSADARDKEKAESKSK